MRVGTSPRAEAKAGPTMQRCETVSRTEKRSAAGRPCPARTYLRSNEAVRPVGVAATYPAAANRMAAVSSRVSVRSAPTRADLPDPGQDHRCRPPAEAASRSSPGPRGDVRTAGQAGQMRQKPAPCPTVAAMDLAFAVGHRTDPECPEGATAATREEMPAGPLSNGRYLPTMAVDSAPRLQGRNWECVGWYR